MTELEKKLMLTEDEYDYLMEHLGYENPLSPKPITTQINYYFDTDDFSMNRQNTTCRIRLKDGKYKATMKKHSTGEDQSTETEMAIYNGLESNAFTNMGLKIQGELITKRCVVFKDANCEAVLDKNEYLGHTDYELEIEYTSEHEKDAQAVMQLFRDMLTRRKCFLAYKESLMKIPSTPSKSSRFFDRKSVTGQASMEEGKTEDTCSAKRNKKEAKMSEISSYDHVGRFDYSHTDDYMSDHYGSALIKERNCPWCERFTGSSCELLYGSCDYEHY